MAGQKGERSEGFFRKVRKPIFSSSSSLNLRRASLSSSTADFLRIRSRQVGETALLKRKMTKEVEFVNVRSADSALQTFDIFVVLIHCNLKKSLVSCLMLHKAEHRHTVVERVRTVDGVLQPKPESHGDRGQGEHPTEVRHETISVESGSECSSPNDPCAWKIIMQYDFRHELVNV
jgi:hypothetical protein